MAISDDALAGLEGVVYEIAPHKSGFYERVQHPTIDFFDQDNLKATSRRTMTRRGFRGRAPSQS